MPFFPASSSASSSNSNFTLFSPTQNSNTLSKFSFKIPIIPLHSSSYLTTTTTTTTTTLTSSCSSKDSTLATAPVLEQLTQNDDVVSKEKELVVRRPVMAADQFSGEGGGVEVIAEENDEDVSDIDVGLTELAKKMPIFEPEERVLERFGSTEKPLTVNLDLALYRAKVLSRGFRYQEAEKMLQKVWYFLSDYSYVK